MKIFFYKCIFYLAIFLVTFLTFLSSNTDNPVRLNSKYADDIYNFLPQGWAFFTRDPKEDVLKLYRINKNSIEYLNGTTSLSLNDMFGIKRDKRKISVELSVIVSEISRESKWAEYRNEDLSFVYKDLEISDSIYNGQPNRLLHQGEYLLYTQKRTPWAWSNSRVNQIYKLKKIYIK